MIEIKNRKSNDYKIDETLDAGIILVGREIKALSKKESDLTGSYVIVKKVPLLIGSYIKVETDKFSVGYEANRDRKILITRAEIRYLKQKIQQGYSVIPIKFFSNDRGLIKIKLGVGRLIKKYDKREKLKYELDRQTIQDCS